jgi:hypothetical protein
VDVIQAVSRGVVRSGKVAIVLARCMPAMCLRLGTNTSEVCIFNGEGFHAKKVMWELSGNIWGTIWKSTDFLLERNDLFVEFEDGRHGVGNCIKAICYTGTDNCVHHMYFLFHDNRTSQKLFALL